MVDAGVDLQPQKKREMIIKYQKQTSDTEELKNLMSEMGMSPEEVECLKRQYAGKRVVVFVPKELQANTLYTVTLKPGVTVPDSELEMTADFRFQFETGSEERTGETPGEPPRRRYCRWSGLTMR